MTVEKGKALVAPAPLGRLIIIDTPFKRVAVDLIWPVCTASDEGHRYTLAVVDHATRYREAVAFKDATTETFADTLVSVFSRVGLTNETLTG